MRAGQHEFLHGLFARKLRPWTPHHFSKRKLRTHTRTHTDTYTHARAHTHTHTHTDTYTDTHTHWLPPARIHGQHTRTNTRRVAYIFSPSIWYHEALLWPLYSPSSTRSLEKTFLFPQATHTI